MIDNETLEKLEKLLSEEHHVIQFSEEGWIIAHPIKERLDGSLFDCSLCWFDEDPGMRGRFWLHDDGTVGGWYHG